MLPIIVEGKQEIIISHLKWFPISSRLCHSKNCEFDVLWFILIDNSHSIKEFRVESQWLICHSGSLLVFIYLRLFLKINFSLLELELLLTCLFFLFFIFIVFVCGTKMLMLQKLLATNGNDDTML